MICFLCREVVFRIEIFDIFIMLEDYSRVIVIIRLANNEQTADIFFCQERKTPSKTGDAVLVSGAGSIIDKSAVCFKIVLPTNFNKTVLVAPFTPGLSKSRDAACFGT